MTYDYNQFIIDMIKTDGSSVVRSLVEPSEELLIAIIDYDLDYFTDFKDAWKTEAVCLAAVKQDGLALYRVKNQTMEICLTAVRQDSWALNYVTNQTLEICLAAAKKDLRSLNYIRDEKIKQWVKKQLTTI